MREAEKSESSTTELLSPTFLKKISTITSKELKSHKSSAGLSKREIKEVTDVFNSIHNLFDNSDINRALRSVHNIDERIILIDKILQRREEVKTAQEMMKIEGNPRLFNKVKQKFISRISLHIPHRGSMISSNENELPQEEPEVAKPERVKIIYVFSL